MALSKTRTHESSALTTSKKRAFRRALTIFREAAQRIPAYKDFLKKSRIKPALIRSESDFAQIPVVDKTNYISRYPLEDLNWDGVLASAKYISSSSGSTGVPFYWPRGRKQDIIVAGMFRRVYEDVFDTRKGSTLCVDSFALGAWIAGLELYNATKWVADVGNNIVLVTPGIDKNVAVDQIKRLASSFDRIVLSGYPPFVKDILEFGSIAGIKWRKHDVRLFTGGEPFSERWRDRVLELIGKNDPFRTSINMYGMAETGIVASETPLSILLRRSSGATSELRQEFSQNGEACPLYQYDPMARYFELGSDNGLILTADAGLPLVRYDTRDRGGILEHATALERYGGYLRSAAKKHRIDLHKWNLPFVYLYGRKDLSISLYALNIYVENIKYALENSKFATHLSGLFTMSVEDTDNLDQQFRITVELSRATEQSQSLIEALTREVVEGLCKLNTEYAKLYSVIGDRAKPAITLVRYGEIQTIPGRKHKWVKRG